MLTRYLREKGCYKIASNISKPTTGADIYFAISNFINFTSAFDSTDKEDCDGSREDHSTYKDILSAHIGTDLCLWGN